MFAAIVAVQPASLAACVSQGSYYQEVQKADSYEQKASTCQQLSSQLKGELATDQAQVTQLQNPVRVSLANTLLFAEGGVKLEAAGEATLARIAPVLKGLTGQKIEIRGFTDNVPIGPELRARYAW
ncbi:MAG: hypothetical protein IAE86_04555 [Burkholderiaceae bacterium]|nr:hypothetical protein [Burkholderiaceae bacterium]